MNCDAVQRLLLEAPDTLPEGVREHLAGCAACRQASACIGWLHGAPMSPGPSPALDGAVLAAARARLGLRRRRGWSLAGPRLWAVAAALALVAGLLAGLVLIGSRPARPGLLEAAGRTSGRVWTWATAQGQWSAIEIGLDAMVAELDGALPSPSAPAGSAGSDGWDDLTRLEFSVYMESQHLGQAGG
ncbi:MAG: hypothetical protein GX595_07010 [Lentisphaerae bacterium]|nr:hypothetical protein [Lentisphaerota bacterium]